MFPLSLLIGTVILAEALWSPLHSRRTLPYFRHEGAVNLPLVAKSTPNPRPAQELPSSSIHWHDESKVAEQQSQLPVQLTHCCGPAWHIPPFRTKTSRPTEHKVTRIGSKISAQLVTTVKSEGCHSHFHSLDSWIHQFWWWERQRHILDADSEHIQPPWESSPNPARYCHQSYTVTILKSPCHQPRKPAAPGRWETWLGARVHSHASFAVKWVPWSTAMLCEIPWRRIRHSVSPRMVVLAEAPCARKANAYAECVFQW